MKHFFQFFFYMITLFSLSSCSSHSKKITVLEYNGKFPDESAKNIEIITSENGVINFTLFAPLMNKYFGDNPYFDFPEGITISSYSNGEKHSTLSADYAISEEHTQRYEAHGNVIIVDLLKKETILTEKIIWDKKNKRIFSDVEIIQIKADGTTNKGDGIEADEKFTKYTITRPYVEMLADDL